MDVNTMEKKMPKADGKEFSFLSEEHINTSYLETFEFDSKNQYDELNLTSLKNRDQLLMFEVANIALSSEHALVNHNRKFFYNQIKDI